MGTILVCGGSQFFPFFSMAARRHHRSDSDSGADEPISSNSNANFQPKQILKHGVAKYSVNNNTTHVDVTTSGLFLVKFW